MTIERRKFLAASAAAMAAPLTITGNAGTWSQAAPIPVKVQEIYPTVHKGQLYIAGGIGARLGMPYFPERVFAYHAARDSWQSQPDLPEALHHVALVSDGDSLLGIGGFNGGYTHVWRMRDAVYRLEDSGWVLHSTLPTPQAEGVATHHNDRIHIVTGQQPKGEANKDRSDHTEGDLHWVYEDSRWQSLAPIPTPRNSATGGWIDDLLIITGGRTAAGNLSVTEIYDASEDRWHQAAPLPLPQAGTASVVIDGSLVVFGGETFRPSANVFANVWRYNLQADQWTGLPNLPTPRHGLGAGVIDNKIYVVGGATEPGGSGTSDANEVLQL